MAFNWEQSAFLGYMVERFEEEQNQVDEYDYDEEYDRDDEETSDNYWPF